MMKNNIESGNRKQLIFSLFVFATVILIFVGVSLFWKKKFPYAGTWVYQNSKGSSIKQKIIFSSSGECRISYENKAWKMSYSDVPCQYTMNGDTANIYYDVHIKYNQRITHPQAIRAQYNEKITPINEGRTLRMDMQEAIVTIRQGDNVWQKEYAKFHEEFVLFTKIIESTED